MARNQEKAQSMLYRFREAQSIEMGLAKPKERRPYLASQVETLEEAERWRRDVIREISRSVSQIHNGSLSEAQIRDLNDEINKLLRTKSHWENRILELGGPDYKKIGPKMLDHQGKEVPGNRGYKYFGRAKELPG
ncbi:NineTeen Complex (NTC) component, partial [Dipsacomyces acuminosporus]